MTGHTVSNATGEAADACALRLITEYERTSPLFAAAIAGLPRQVVLGLLGIAFTDGSIYGAERIAGRLAHKSDEKVNL